MVEFREITHDELEEVLALAVAPNQADLVSPNVKTMAEAPYEAGALVRAMWRGGRAVGLIAMLRPSAYPEEEDIIIRRDAAYIWRLMVGEGFQGQGLSRQALDEAKRTAIGWGYRALTLSVGDKPHSARPFYERYGFELTGRRLWDEDDELEMILRFDD